MAKDIEMARLFQIKATIKTDFYLDDLVEAVTSALEWMDVDLVVEELDIEEMVSLADLLRTRADD